RRELAEGIESLLGWCKRVRQKKIETRWKIIGGSRKACLERCNGVSPKFAKRFEGIGKLAGNTLGDRRNKIGRLVARMLEAAGLAGVEFNWLTKLQIEFTYWPGRVNRQKCPDSWVWAVQPPSLGSSTTQPWRFSR
ncbi:hypothetical protein B296_00053689, partial [Ensete ventricosum]